MQFTGEQYIPGISKPRLAQEHEARYAFALEFASGKRVLDAACGTGYGTNILSKAAANAIGIDSSEESINFAKSNYFAPNLQFVRTQIQSADFASDSFDLICSFETIEHLNAEERSKCLEKFQSWLVPGGLLLLSTPNKTITSPFSAKPLNKFHILEFTRQALINELYPFFNIRQILGQRLVPGWLTKKSIRYSIRAVEKVLGKEFSLYTLANGPAILQYNPRKFEPRIHVIVCSLKK